MGQGQRGERGPRGESGGTPKRIIASFVALILISIAVVGGMGYSVTRANRAIAENGKRIEENEKTRLFLCAQRDNLQKSVAAGKGLDLNAVAERIGIPVTMLKDSQERDRMTLKTMEILDCKEAP